MNHLDGLQCPLNIAMLLHFHVSTERFENDHTEVAQQGISRLLNYRAIRSLGDDLNGAYETTPLGKAWVDALCNVPPPKQVFMDEQGRIVQ